jgi:hypothetical protein
MTCVYCGDAKRIQIVSPVSDHAWADCFCVKLPALSSQQATVCSGCEGKPAPENNPCAVCGKQAAGEAEAVALPPMPSCDDREPFGKLPFSDTPLDYMESNRDWAYRNNEVVEWLADNHAAIRAALATPQPTETQRTVAWMEKEAADCRAMLDRGCSEEMAPLYLMRAGYYDQAASMIGRGAHLVTSGEHLAGEG